jgi:hypothetical protein
MARLKQSAAELKNTARSIALVLIINLPGAKKRTYGSLKKYYSGL